MQARHRSFSQAWLVGGIIALSAANAVLGAVAVGRGVQPSESTEVLWTFAFSLLISVWLKNDMIASGMETGAQVPGYVIFLFWLLVLPYHLVKSRGAIGLMLFAGFLALYFAPWFVELMVWAQHAS
jgi:hypothetical protein